MSSGLTPIRRHGGLENVSRALAVLTALFLAGIVVLVLVDRSSKTLNNQGGTGSGVAAIQARSLPVHRRRLGRGQQRRGARRRAAVGHPPCR